MTAGLRPVRLEDADAINGLMREARFKTRSLPGWRWLFFENPARCDARVPAGWVLERDGELAGYLGNIPLACVFDGRPLSAATCNSYYVRPDARGDSARLMSAFFRQANVELFCSTTANAASVAVYRLFKAAVPEDESFREELAWIADDAAVLRSLMEKRGVPQGLSAALAGACAAPSGLVRRALRYAEPGRSAPFDVREVRADEIDERFDTLWSELARTPGLRVKRDARALRWYLADPDAVTPPVLFAAFDESTLIGYAIAAPSWPAEARAPELVIADVLVRPGGERALGALVRATVAHARRRGIGWVYARSFGEALTSALKTLRPLVRRKAEPTHYVRAARRGETASFTAPGVWHATTLDGDSPFCFEYPAAEPR